MNNSGIERLPTPQTDEELYCLFIDTKSETAFEELHFRYYAKLVGYTLKHYLPGQFTAAEDVVQQTFVKLCESTEKFDRKKLLKPWLYRFAANTAINHIEYMSVRPSRPLIREDRNRGHFQNNEPVDTTDENTATLELQERQLARLWEVAETLPAQQRQAVEYVFRDGLTNVEAAEKMNVTTNTLGVWIFRAVAAMRRKVTREFAAEAA